MRAYRRLRLKVFVGLIVAGAVLALPSYASATAGGRWHVLTRAFPTTLVEGSVPTAGVVAREALPHYSVRFRDVGGGGATGPVTVSVTLPSGISTDPSFPPEIKPLNAKEVPCEVPAGDRIICLAKAGQIPSGESVAIDIPLDVGTSVPNPAVGVVEVTGGSIPSVTEAFSVAVGGPEAPFEFLSGSSGLVGQATTEAGLDEDRAGSHPFSVLLDANFTSKERNPTLAWPVEAPKDISFQLPRGMVVNPQAPSSLCTERELVSQAAAGIGEKGCPAASQVGVLTVNTVVVGVGVQSLPLYEMQPPPGVPAELGFNIVGTVVHIQGGLDGVFHLTAGSSDILAKYPILGFQAYLWGNPADPRHDAERRGKEESRRVEEEPGRPEGAVCGLAGCGLTAAEANKVPFVTMPTACGEALSLNATAAAWEGGHTEASSWLLDTSGAPLEMHGCGELAFEPTIESKATTGSGESPSGLEFSIHQVQDESLEGRSTAALKDASVALPDGMTLNPSAANGLGSCSEAQMGYAPELEPGKIRFDTKSQKCPNSAKVGTLEATTPLLGHPLPGSIYVATPFKNPFGSLLAIYLAVEDKESGIVAKLAGKVEPDPRTGQLAATFTENPELPLNDISLHFFGDGHGVLTTPLTCGTKTTTSRLTPWSTPEGADAHPTASFEINSGCASSEAAAPKSASLIAGTETPLSGAYSPFSLRIARPDGSQHITGIDTTLPEGLLGKLAGVAYCPESGIAQAIAREKPEQGKLEQSSPSCPSSSEVGTVIVTAGSGSSPIPVSGHAYLAGPYKGAPLSLVAIVPAVAGPFDLGTVVDRVALNVGEYDARIHAVADPLPTIREGIPLDVRSIELKLNRPSFTLNPTSCEAMQIEATVSTQPGQSQPVSNRFQVGECGRLAFKPKLQLSLKGPTKRTGHPAVKAVVTYPKQGAYANIARAQVNLPHSEFLDQGNIGKACTKVLIAQQACPEKSIYGKAKAWSPLLEKPLEGPVYLVGGYGYKLPAMVAELKGQIRVLLVGKVDTGKNKGIRNTFEVVPDAPVSRFVLELKGGKKYGLLENSENVCKKTQKAGVSFRAQNGKVLTTSTKISNSCGGPKGKKKGKKSKH